jgi:hypothetical protein
MGEVLCRWRRGARVDMFFWPPEHGRRSATTCLTFRLVQALSLIGVASAGPLKAIRAHETPPAGPARLVWLYVDIELSGPIGQLLLMLPSSS